MFNTNFTLFPASSYTVPSACKPQDFDLFPIWLVPPPGRIPGQLSHSRHTLCRFSISNSLRPTTHHSQLNSQGQWRPPQMLTSFPHHNSCQIFPFNSSLLFLKWVSPSGGTKDPPQLTPRPHSYSRRVWVHRTAVDQRDDGTAKCIRNGGNWWVLWPIT